MSADTRPESAVQPCFSLNAMKQIALGLLSLLGNSDVPHLYGTPAFSEPTENSPRGTDWINFNRFKSTVQYRVS